MSMDLINSIRLAFKDKDIVIRVSETIDETEYLLSSPANKEVLFDAIRQLEQGEGVTMTIEELRAKYQK